jgi:hypothetical protein
LDCARVTDYTEVIRREHRNALVVLRKAYILANDWKIDSPELILPIDLKIAMASIPILPAPTKEDRLPPARRR